MAMTFYWISGSPYAWRVMLALEYKGLEYESRRLDPAKGEHKTADYLAMNPRGKVPVLQDGDFTVYESLAILTYLEKVKPDPNLLGSTARETAQIWQSVCEFDNYVAPAVMAIVGPVLFESGKAERSEIEKSAVAIHDELESLNQQLTESEYVAGDRLTAADLTFLPIVQYLVRACTKQELDSGAFGFLPLEQRYPFIAQWLKRVEAMPGYSNAYPPHWRT